MTITVRTQDDRPVWFVYANAQGFQDQLTRFVRDGVWENLVGDREASLVNSVQVGDRIAIRSLYRRESSELAFETRRDQVMSMTIRATGFVTGNTMNGRTLEVDWTLVDPPREWYFYADGRRVWPVALDNVNERNRWKAEALIAFVFENEAQDIERFLEGDRPGPGIPPPLPPFAEDPSLRRLADELTWGSIEPLEGIIRGLKDKGQVIFQGPPGTGKTYVAKAIAEWLTQGGGGYKVVQFHPSYTYEDFVEGFRPTLNEETGQAGYRLVHGPLRRMAKDAQENPDDIFVLVIDEVNRGNLAKILGELYFLLEYRNEEVDLQYSDEPFRLPTNLWFIGTMNTTDRSIALVDAALRRRFYFFGFYPDQEPISSLLRRWLEKTNSDALWIDNLLRKANSELPDHHLQIGPSHFMKNKLVLNEETVKFIWNQAVLPYIEEQFFGRSDEINKFSFETLMSVGDRIDIASNTDGSLSAAATDDDSQYGDSEGDAAS